MSKKIMLICALVFTFMVGAIASGFSPTANADETKLPQKIISVNSEGIVKVKPDMAYINVGVQTENKSSKVAQQENSTKMNKVMQVLKENKIVDLDIKTSQYTIYPNETYSEKDKVSTVTGYRVINTLEITIRDISKVGAVIDAVSANEANTVSDIRFTVADPDKYYLQALQNATVKAKAKADTLAKQFEIKIGLPSQINETSGGSNPPIIYSAMDSVKSEASKTSISSGELEIRASVGLVYTY
ncbi:SIMPL domain-containing protein [Clostridium sp.]|uniref:SIMPL domain-containing protein n=1 Tax=Clostridium sp. TaxID=1506 RepID=UPI003D6C9D30